MLCVLSLSRGMAGVHAPLGVYGDCCVCAQGRVTVNLRALLDTVGEQRGSGAVSTAASCLRTVTLISVADRISAGTSWSGLMPMGPPVAWTDKLQNTGSDAGIILEFAGLPGDVPDEQELVLDLVAVFKTSPGRFKIVLLNGISYEGRVHKPPVMPNAVTVSLDGRQTDGSSVAGVGLALAHNEVSGGFLVHTVHPGSPAAESSMVMQLLAHRTLNAIQKTFQCLMFGATGCLHLPLLSRTRILKR